MTTGEDKRQSKSADHVAICGPSQLVKIDDGQSVHVRTAAEWIALARRDFESAKAPSSGERNEIIEECAKIADECRVLLLADPGSDSAIKFTVVAKETATELARQMRLLKSATIQAATEREEIEGSWPKGDLRRAFVEGVKWWEWTSRGATMWPDDRNRAEEEAARRYTPSATENKIAVDVLRNAPLPPTSEITDEMVAAYNHAYLDHCERDLPGSAVRSGIAAALSANAPSATERAKFVAVGYVNCLDGCTSTKYEAGRLPNGERMLYIAHAPDTDKA